MDNKNDSAIEIFSGTRWECQMISIDLYMPQ